jgi:hypothetical protein
MSMVSGSLIKCSCITQQGTVYKVEKNTCIQIAKYGVFDPFHSSRRDLQREEARDRSADEGRAGRMQAQAQPAASAPAYDYSLSSLQVPHGSGAFSSGPTSNASGPIVSPADRAPASSFAGAPSVRR